MPRSPQNTEIERDVPATPPPSPASDSTEATFVGTQNNHLSNSTGSSTQSDDSDAFSAAEEIRGLERLRMSKRTRSSNQAMIRALRETSQAEKEKAQPIRPLGFAYQRPTESSQDSSDDESFVFMATRPRRRR